MCGREPVAWLSVCPPWNLTLRRLHALHATRMRCCQAVLRGELCRMQEVAAKLDVMARLAEEEAATLRVQFRAQEDDRHLLIM